MRIAVLFILMVSVLVNATAYAVERGCQARLYVKKGDTELLLDRFSARGTRSHPNDARRAARAKLIDCAREAKIIRHQHRKPDHCTERWNVHGYEIDSLKVSIETVACSISAFQKGTLDIRLATSGDKRCGSDQSIMNYDITQSICGTRLVWESGFDRPGNNYKNFPLSQINPGQCQQACNDDRQCRAWTYVKPNLQGREPHCWLKSSASTKQPAGCCVSGLKGTEVWTDRPGRDYKNFVVKSEDPAACQAACARDGRCRAWTFVRDRPQTCWLKDGVPAARRAGCCISGVKE